MKNEELTMRTDEQDKYNKKGGKRFFKIKKQC